MGGTASKLEGLSRVLKATSSEGASREGDSIEAPKPQSPSLGLNCAVYDAAELFYIGYVDSGPYRLFASKGHSAFASGKGGKSAPSKARRASQAGVSFSFYAK